MSEIPKKRDSLALALLIGSAFVFLLSLLGSGVILLFAGISLLIGNPEAAQSSWTLSILLFCLSLLTAPALYLAWRSPRPEIHRRGLQLPGGIIFLAILFPLILLAGAGASKIPALAWTLPSSTFSQQGFLSFSPPCLSYTEANRSHPSGPGDLSRVGSGFLQL